MEDFKNYRVRHVVTYGWNYYSVQHRRWLFWHTVNDADGMPVRFISVREAEGWIRHKTRQDAV